MVKCPVSPCMLSESTVPFGFCAEDSAFVKHPANKQALGAKAKASPKKEDARLHCLKSSHTLGETNVTHDTRDPLCPWAQTDSAHHSPGTSRTGPWSQDNAPCPGHFLGFGHPSLFLHTTGPLCRSWLLWFQPGLSARHPLSTELLLTWAVTQARSGCGCRKNCCARLQKLQSSVRMC